MSKKFLYLNLIISSLFFPFNVFPMLNFLTSKMFTKDSSSASYQSNEDKLASLSTKIAYEKKYLQSTNLGTGAVFAAGSAYFVKGLFNIDDFKKIGAGVGIVSIAAYFGYKHGNQIKHQLNPFSVNIDKLEIEHNILNAAVEKDKKLEERHEALAADTKEVLARAASLNRKFEAQGKVLLDQTQLIQKLQADNVALARSIDTSKEEIKTLVESTAGKSQEAIQAARAQIEAIQGRIDQAARAIDSQFKDLGDQCEQSVKMSLKQMQASHKELEEHCAKSCQALSQQIENVRVEVGESERRIASRIDRSAFDQGQLTVEIAKEADGRADARHSGLLTAMQQRSTSSPAIDAPTRPFTMRMPYSFGVIAGSQFPYQVRAIEGGSASQDIGAGTGDKAKDSDDKSKK